jgi:hypothetical protein
VLGEHSLADAIGDSLKKYRPISPKCVKSAFDF